MTLTPDQYNHFYDINYNNLEVGKLYQHSEVVYEPNMDYIAYFLPKQGSTQHISLTRKSIILLCQKTKVSFGIEYKILFGSEFMYRIFYAPFNYDKKKLTIPILKKVY